CGHAWPVQLLGAEGYPASVVARVSAVTSALVSSYVTTAVFSLYDTTALLTPGTASRLLRTMNGQSAQYMFFTASVMVFSAANVADEARTLTVKATDARSLLIGILRSRIEKWSSRAHHGREHSQRRQTEQRKLHGSLTILVSTHVLAAHGS